MKGTLRVLFDIMSVLHGKLRYILSIKVEVDAQYRQYQKTPSSEISYSVKMFQSIYIFTN